MAAPAPPPVRTPPMLAPVRGVAASVRFGVGATALVETPSGPRPAGGLRAGVLVRAADGKWRMVRRISWERCAPGEAVSFAAGALADGVPGQELCVAAGQALLLESFVWPAAFLADGAAVARLPGGCDVVRLATDAPAAILVGGVGCLCVVPPGRPAPDAGLARLRRVMAARAGRAFGPLEGACDAVVPGKVEGWTRELSRPGVPVLVALHIDGAVVAHAFADRARADLAAAGLGDCAFSFDTALPGRGMHTLELRRAEDGALLPGGVALLAADAGADLAAPPEALAAALASLTRVRLRRGPPVHR